MGDRACVSTPTSSRQGRPKSVRRKKPSTPKAGSSAGAAKKSLQDSTTRKPADVSLPAKETSRLPEAMTPTAEIGTAAGADSAVGADSAATGCADSAAAPVSAPGTASDSPAARQAADREFKALDTEAADGGEGTSGSRPVNPPETMLKLLLASGDPPLDQRSQQKHRKPTPTVHQSLPVAKAGAAAVATPPATEVTSKLAPGPPMTHPAAEPMTQPDIEQLTHPGRQPLTHPTEDSPRSAPQEHLSSLSATDKQAPNPPVQNPCSATQNVEISSPPTAKNDAPKSSHVPQLQKPVPEEDVTDASSFVTDSTSAASWREMSYAAPTAPPTNRSAPLINQSAPPTNRSASLANRSAPLANPSAPLTDRSEMPTDRSELPTDRSAPLSTLDTDRQFPVIHSNPTWRSIGTPKPPVGNSKPPVGTKGARTGQEEEMQTGAAGLRVAQGLVGGEGSGARQQGSTPRVTQPCIGKSSSAEIWKMLEDADQAQVRIAAL